MRLRHLSSNINRRELYLIYDIFDESLCKDVKYLNLATTSSFVSPSSVISFQKYDNYWIQLKDYVNLQLTWILIGNPADIGIFDKNTLNIAVICSENTSFTFQNDRTDLIARLKVTENLSTNSILITSIK
ncbi:1268_t:CDS:2 [Gigaspora rosea]|nr:1268_t:CDS:2 [Gigaspora rosea]